MQTSRDAALVLSIHEGDVHGRIVVGLVSTCPLCFSGSFYYSAFGATDGTGS